MTQKCGSKFNHLRSHKVARYPSKLARKLARHGSLYGPVSIVAAAFNEIRKARFKERNNVSQ